MIGNLAWAPSPAFEEVEVLDRFNGVPTLGVFGKPGERILFWRALGYVPADEISAWIYVTPQRSGRRAFGLRESFGALVWAHLWVRRVA
jgi:hypothetical protein